MENEELNQNNEEIETAEEKDLFYEAADYVLSESPKIIERINNGENGMLFTFAEQAYIASGKPRDEEISKLKSTLEKSKEIILRLYNAGRDVLMCRAEEKAYDNLSNAINDKSIEQFLSEAGK